MNLIETAASEARRIHEGIATRRELGHESVLAAHPTGLKRMKRRKVRRTRGSADVDVSRRVEADARGGVAISTAEIRRIQESASGGIELGDERILHASSRALKSIHEREGGRRAVSFVGFLVARFACHVRVARRIDRYPESDVTAGSPQKRGVHQRVAGRRKLGDERVAIRQRA